MTKTKETSNYVERKVGSSNSEGGLDELLLEENSQGNNNLNKVNYNREK